MKKSSCCSSLLFLWPPASRYAHTAKKKKKTRSQAAWSAAPIRNHVSQINLSKERDEITCFLICMGNSKVKKKNQNKPFRTKKAILTLILYNTDFLPSFSVATNSLITCYAGHLLQCRWALDRPVHGVLASAQVGGWILHAGVSKTRVLLGFQSQTG